MWLLTLECLGAVEVAAGSELAVDTGVEPELPDALLLLVVEALSAFVDRETELCAAATVELLDPVRDRAGRFTRAAA